MKNKKIRILILCMAVTPVLLICGMFGWELRCKTRTYKEMASEISTVQDAVFRIVAEVGTDSTAAFAPGASGTVIAKQDDLYYALTALHVVSRADALHYYAVPADAPAYEKPADMPAYTYSKQYYSAMPELKTEFQQPENDLAVVSFRYAGELPVPQIKHDDVLNHTRLAVAAFDDTPYAPVSVTYGDVNGRNYWEFHVDDGLPDVRVFSHSAYVTYGSSGAAAFDYEMKLAGINVGGVNGVFGTFRSGVIVPAWSLRECAEKWQAASGVTVPVLG